MAEALATSATTAPATALARLFRPRSIAVAGASDDPRSTGGTILSNIEAFGFAGDLHLISPTREQIGGRPCLKSVDDLPEGVDVVILNIPKVAILPAVRGCAAKGVGAVVVFAAGFAESGPEGRAEQEELTRICRDAGMAMLGPNCLGLVNFRDSVALTFEPVKPAPLGDMGGVAVIAQSGAMSSAMRSAMLARGIPVATGMATGNEAVTDAADLIAHIVAEKMARAVVLYCEQVRDPKAFLAAAREARAAGIPIVMLHPGRSEAGQHAAASHTGSMVGDHDLMTISVENAGVVTVTSMDEMFDCAALLLRWPDIPGGKLGIVTNSGALRGLAFDFADEIGMELASIGPTTVDRIEAALPGGMHVDNPVDIGTSGFASGDIFGVSTAALLDDPDVGAVLLTVAGGNPTQQRMKSDAVVPEVVGSKKPVAFAVVGDESPLDEDFRRALRDSGTPLFRSPERAMRAFRTLARHAERQGDGRSQMAAVDLPALGGEGTKTEAQGKDLLRALGITTPQGALVSSPKEASAAAQRIGYPVVIKAQASALSHKSDVGGVILNIADETALASAWDALHANIGNVPLDGVLVEAMSAPGLEMIVGARNHPDWGPSVLIGLGGVLTEALSATVLLPADASKARILREIGRLRGAKLLGPFRGRPARDVEAVADVALKLGAAMRAGIGIEEIEINPLMVHGVGEGASALDALVVVSDNEGIA